MYGIEAKKEFNIKLNKENWALFNDYYIQTINENVEDHENILTGFEYRIEDIDNGVLTEIQKIFEIGTIYGAIVYKAKEVPALDLHSIIGIL